MVEHLLATTAGGGFNSWGRLAAEVGLGPEGGPLLAPAEVAHAIAGEGWSAGNASDAVVECACLLVCAAGLKWRLMVAVDVQHYRSHLQASTPSPWPADAEQQHPGTELGRLPLRAIRERLETAPATAPKVAALVGQRSGDPVLLYACIKLVLAALHEGVSFGVLTSHGGQPPF